MRALSWLLLLALLAGVAALLAVRDGGGNVVFLVSPQRIDLSLNFFILIGVVVLIGVYWIARLVQRMVDFPARVASYRARRGEIGGTRALRDALRALFEGRFARAERAAQAAQQLPEIAGLAALVGARAAARMQEQQRRDAWLERAEFDRTLDTARLVTSAELWTESREHVRALDAVEQLRAGGGRHIEVARIALTAQMQTGRWDDALKTVRLLAKRKALHEAVAQRIKLAAYRERLQDKRHDAAALQAAFDAIPAEDRRAVDVALDAARLLNLAGRAHAAAQALEASLDFRWDIRLLDEYARTRVFPGRGQIERAEGWRERHPNDATLLRTLGALCLREQLWGKARTYFEESLRERSHPATLLGLARLAEATGAHDEARQQYREAALGYANLVSEIGAGNSRGSSRAMVPQKELIP